GARADPAGVADQKALPAVAEKIAVAGQLPFEAESAERGVADRAVLDLAEIQRAADHIAGVADQKLRLPVAAKISIAGEMPLAAEPADRGVRGRAANDLADIERPRRHIADVANEEPGIVVAEQKAVAAELPLRPEPAEPG